MEMLFLLTVTFVSTKLSTWDLVLIRDASTTRATVSKIKEQIYRAPCQILELI